MTRVVCVCLSDWPVTRLRRAGLAPESPLAVAADGPGGLRLVALDAGARALGLRPGEPLGRVRARIGVPLHVRPADPEADAAALLRLCRWAGGYAPGVSPFGPAEGGHGLYIDVAGASHLRGGEAALLDDLAGRLARGDVPARVALADTPGGAFALAAHGPADRILAPPGAAAMHLRDLPVAALRLDPGTVAGLRRLGLRRIGALDDQPRGPLARRFGEAPLLRLDQALGRRPEPLAPLAAPDAFAAARGFLDPIGRQADVVAAARGLMAEIAPRLERAGLGACALRLALHRVDGLARALDIGLSRPERCPERVAALVSLRLDRLGAGLDAGFGFETVALTVTATGAVTVRQGVLGAEPAGERVGALADALAQRLGRRLVRLAPRESHRPERAERALPWDGADPSTSATAPWPDHLPPRPLVIFAQGEPARDVLAAAPDGPPRRFRWRAREHRVARAEGPERIAAEWWRAGGGPRDYYRIECEAGRRLWLYRDGPHAPDRPAAWYVHGIFP
ncbi:DNA polymerase Y family protein [Methylobacterium sp. NEAU 140]|uniref:DNA polymerase Y family protein n=1 Tax=Methylobacterium sp. NEAU 140 TaxID=3064945 RepID=UPI0027369097|nr:DNA polymerase Y family protein [Methylobacterium sp. NEAU 140]MDP4022930.1 DNA polymerase Y family protein [Methylobacterium sp. NEAU 140]